MRTPKKFLVLMSLSLSLVVVTAESGLSADSSVKAAPAKNTKAKENNAAIFATIGKEKITAQEFFAVFQDAMKKKYYHGKVPADEMARFQRKVGRRMVENYLLLKEAARLGLKADQKKIDLTIAKVEAKFGNNPQFRENREMMLKPVIQDIVNRDLLAQIEARARNVAEPDEDMVKKFYDAYPDKFTEPNENKVSVILLKVDPSAGNEAWEAARLKAEELIKRIKSGEDFATLSKEHSGDKSASKGGKMGYLHKGMLAPAAEEALDKLKVGEITDPIFVLEGVGIFRLDDRIETELVPFEKAHNRVKELLKREQGELAWQDLKDKLWAKGSVKINEALYLPLQEEAPASTAQPNPSAATATGASSPSSSGKP